MIEIQKGKDDQDVLRFRSYLRANYRTSDKVKLDNGEVEGLDLPIISIYFIFLVFVSNPSYKSESSLERTRIRDILHSPFLFRSLGSSNL